MKNINILEYIILFISCVLVALVYTHITKHESFEDVATNIIACVALLRTCYNKRKE